MTGERPTAGGRLFVNLPPGAPSARNYGKTLAGRWWERQHIDDVGTDWNSTPDQRAAKARRGSRVGVTKPTIAARRAQRRAKRKRTGR